MGFWDTAGETRTDSLVTIFYGPLYMDMLVLADQPELIYINSMQTQDVVWITIRYGWMERERESQENGCWQCDTNDDDDDDDVEDSNRNDI